MISAIAFKFVFLSQIFILSYFMPRVMINSVKNRKGKSRLDREVQDGDYVNDKHRFYILLNHTVIFIGLALLALISVHSIFESITFNLLAIGIFFIIQMFPLVMLLINFDSNLLTNMNKPADRSLDSISLFDAVHPLSIGIACLLFVAYIAMALNFWNGGWDSHLKQVIVFVITNLFLVCMMGVQIYAIKNAKSEQRLDSIKIFKKAAPLFVYISIVISIYYFSKILLSNFDLHEYRPIMMSVFIQLLGSLAFYQMTRAFTAESQHNK